MSTAWEEIEGAALSLARSGPIKDRLSEAYRKHLARIDIEELPGALHEEFRAFHDALTRERPMQGEDAVRATVRKMSTYEADELACSVVRLFAALVRETLREAAPVLTNGSVNGNGLNGGASRVKMSNGVLQVTSLYAGEA